MLLVFHVVYDINNDSRMFQYFEEVIVNGR